MYHHVSPNEGDMVTVTPGAFSEQMRHLAGAGYRTLSLDELTEFIGGRGDFGGRCVVVTFDDGYLDNYVHAWPVLKELGIKAAFFVVTGWADAASAAHGGARGPGPERRALIEEFLASRPTHSGIKGLIRAGEADKAVMDWEMIREMASTGLAEFHSHTVSHRNCDRLSGQELASELAGSKRRMEDALGTTCRYLCWPRGRYTPDAVSVARDAGYRGLFTTVRGAASAGTDPMAIERIVVKEGLKWFKSRLRIYTSPVLSGLYTRLRGR